MTGISTDFMQSPRYQRTVQKIAAMNPDQQKTLKAIGLDKSFAASDIQNKLKLAQYGADRLAKQRTFASARSGMNLAKKRFKTGKKYDRLASILAGKKRKWGKKQSKIADFISGADVLASGYLGYQQMKQGRKPASPTGLSAARPQSDFENTRTMMAQGINMALSQFTGVTGLRRPKRYREIIEAGSEQLPQMVKAREDKAHKDKLFGIEQERMGLDRDRYRHEKKMAKEAEYLARKQFKEQKKQTNRANIISGLGVATNLLAGSGGGSWGASPVGDVVKKAGKGVKNLWSGVQSAFGSFSGLFGG